jgi:hypothetical protein
MSVFQKVRGTTASLFALGAAIDQLIFMDRSGNDLRLADKKNTVPATLTDLIGLLETEPANPGSTYSVTRVGGVVTQEKWVRTADGSNLKTLDYTYTSGKLTTEVRKVYATDGVTIIAQVTMTYTYSGSLVIGIATVRNV